MIQSARFNAGYFVLIVVCKSNEPRQIFMRRHGGSRNGHRHLQEDIVGGWEILANNHKLMASGAISFGAMTNVPKQG